MYILLMVIFYPYLWLFYKTKTLYEDKKIQNKKIKNVIISANHKSKYDYVFFSFSFRRKLYYFKTTKPSLFEYLLGARYSSEENLLNNYKEVLNKGKNVIIFNHDISEKLLAFNNYSATLALELNKNVVPVYTNGRYHLFRCAHLVIGKSINITDINKGTREIKKSIMNLTQISHKRDCYNNYGRGFNFRKILTDNALIQIYIYNLILRAKKNKKKKIKGGAIIVSNHMSMFDPIIVTNIFKGRRIYFMTAEILFDGHPFRSFMLRQLGCVRIDRNNADFNSMDEFVDIVSNGGILLVFPTGHIDKDSDFSDIKGGTALIAQQANVPMIPIYIHEKTKKGYNVSIGEDINPSDYFKSKFATPSELQNVNDVIKERLISLRDE